MVVGLRERKKLESWRAIRIAALDLFEARGFEVVSIDDIARQADVSRTTFFNYFASKEAVVFDPDPEDRDQLRTLMDARPMTEDLWTSLQIILLQNVSRYEDRFSLQKKLKASSPKLAASSREMIRDYGRDLHAWAAGRTSGSAQAVTALQVDVAIAVMVTAYERWDPNARFGDLLDLAAELFEAVTTGFAHTKVTISSRRSPAVWEKEH